MILLQWLVRTVPVMLNADSGWCLHNCICLSILTNDTQSWRARVCIVISAVVPVQRRRFLSFNNHITGLSSDVLNKKIKRRA